MEKRVGDYVIDLTLPESEWLQDINKVTKEYLYNTTQTIKHGRK